MGSEAPTDRTHARLAELVAALSLGIDLGFGQPMEHVLRQCLKEIAERLVISPKTVGTHAEHIYAKIRAPSRAAAGLFAMQHGLLPEESFEARVAV